MAFHTIGIVIISVILHCNASPVLIEADTRALEDSYRIPNDIKPISYDITLTLGPDVFTTNKFTGIARIDVEITKETRQIYLHKSIELNITRAESGTEGQIPLSAVLLQSEYNATTEIILYELEDPLVASKKYTLVFEYETALITKDMYGLYKSSYVDENNNTQYLATTQFEATYARRAFPCFDEPGFKAEFTIKITHPEGFTAVSNMPGARSDPAGGQVATTFQRSPRMPTYLVAFIVSTFTCTPGVSFANNVTYQVCSREQSASTRQYAVDIGPKLIAELERFTSVPYSDSRIPKMDQFAIPDFAAGAMENWGLVTYRETALLWDAVESSNRYKQRVASVVAHEFAHQWFGNLVTCHWWSDLFLNEGFATYFEYFATGNVETNWEMDKQFVVEQVQSVLVEDAGNLSPLTYQVSNQNAISGRFNSASYNKGGSILRMVDTIMGTDNFRNGLTAYLRAREFDTATPKHLWDNLQPFVPNGALPEGVNLSQVMENWVTTSGYPIITVRPNGSDVIISQKRFRNTDAASTQTWYVPISYTTSTDANGFNVTTARIWLTPQQPERTIPGVLNAANWIVLNNQQRGYFRVAYEDELFANITLALQDIGFAGIHELNRAQFIDDLLNRARYNQFSYSDILQSFDFLRHDTSYYSWYSFFVGFNQMYQRTGQQNVRDALFSYTLDLMKNFYNSVPFNKEILDDQIYTHKQVLAVTWACRLNVTDCIQNSIAAFQSYRNTQRKPSKNLRAAIYCTALRDSTQPKEDWDFLWSEFGKTDVSTEQVTIISALGCSSDRDVLNNYLKMSITENSGIRPQDALSVFSAVYSNNPDGVDIALDFLIANHQDITKYYTGMNSLNSLVNGISGRLTKDEQIEKLKTFSDDPQVDATLRSYAQNGVTAANNNMNWTRSFEQQLNEYFLKTPSPSSASTGFTGFTAFFGILSVIVMQYLRV